MKILMIIRKLRYSGAYKMFMWLAKALADSGLEVTVCTWANNDVETLPDNIKWIKLDLDGKDFFSVSRAIRNIVKEVDADVGISFLLDGNVYNTIGCMGRRTKSVICERNDPFKPGYYKLKFWKPLFRFADGAVFQLPKVAEYYNNVKGVTAVIPNPVFCDNDITIKPFEDREDKIVTLGRLTINQKRHDLLIRSFVKFKESHPTYKLYIYGDGPDRQSLLDLISELKSEDSILLPGVTLSPLDAIKDAKLFVLTSDYEGIPNALIEAMSIGLPCISTDCRPGGARLLIKDGVNGCLVPVGDETAICERFCKVADDSVFAESIGLQARRIVNEYSQPSITKLWLDYINKLAK